MTADEIFDQAMTFDFFSRVGSRDVVEFGECEVTRVESWRHACELRGSDDASNAFLEAANRLTSKLSADFRQEYRRWNSIIKSLDVIIRNGFDAFLDFRISKVAELRDLDWGPHFVKETVVWDFVHYAAEQAYAEYVAPCFYTRIFEVYRNGRFPCHWNGIWLKGQFWMF